MKPHRFLAAASLCALVALSAPAFAGGVDKWDAARDPKAEADEKTYAAAESMLLQAEAAKHTRDPVMARGAEIVAKDFATTARTLLDEIHAETHPDLRFRFLLADALETLDDDSRTIAVLRPTLELAPDGPDLARAYFHLGIAYARTNQSRDEVHCYDRCLRLDTGGLRSLVLNNRAESSAKLGDFAASIADYREAIELAPEDTMARWGLAVTLDRSGDWERAVEEAVLADAIEEQQHQMVHSSIDRVGVFFVPEYDRDWYHAIRSVAMAHRATRAIDKMTAWETAAILYKSFLAHAVKTDRWIPLARARLKLCEVKAAAAKAKVKSEAALDRSDARSGDASESYSPRR